ncbi:MAG TPA: hypothetical protein VFV01_05710 [Spirillospora sp.]|nr:hypothetical protein [Spirillospora sp.]
MPRENSEEAPSPSTGRQTLLVWIAVLPTLTAVQVSLGAVLERLPAIVRPMIVATVVVPIVMLVVMPRLLRLHERFGVKRPRTD